MKRFSKSLLLFVISLFTVFFLGVTPSQADNFFNRLFGGRAISGSGDLETEEREVDSFDAIKLSGAFDVYIEIGDEQRVEVTFDDNLLDLVRTRVRGHTLHIYSEESYRSRRDCKVEITVPSLEEIVISGSGDVRARGLKADEFNVEISGSGDVTLEGTAEDVDIRISGSGDVDARRFEAKDARVHVSGSGDVSIFASEGLNASVSGSGDIVYYGDPENLRTRVSGSGDIRGRR